MKKSTKQLIFVLLIGALVWFVSWQTGLTEKISTKLGAARLGNETLCYAVGRTNSGDDVYAFRMNVVGGSVVSGELALIPYEKDIKAGEFRGEISGINEDNGLWKADLIWTAIGEGVVNEEELAIQFNRDAVLIGFGEMEPNQDGRYVYANPDDIVYGVAVPASSCTGATAQ